MDKINEILKRALAHLDHYDYQIYSEYIAHSYNRDDLKKLIKEIKEMLKEKSKNA